MGACVQSGQLLPQCGQRLQKSAQVLPESLRAVPELGNLWAGAGRLSAARKGGRDRFQRAEKGDIFSWIV